MRFTALLDAFTRHVEAGDGAAFAALFAEDGVYHDRFYGDATGREAIARLIGEQFRAEGERFHWRFREPVFDGHVGYAAFAYAYTARGRHNAGRRVALKGMSRFRLRAGLIYDYDDCFDGGVMLAQLGTPPDVMHRVFTRWSEHLPDDPEIASLLKDTADDR
jgi:ketosteroid isomerase-like protein